MVVFYEYRYAIRTSALLGLYLAVGVLIDGTKSRSYFLRGMNPLAGVSVAAAVVRFALVILEEVPKVRLLVDAELRVVSTGEVSCGFFSRTFFLFLQPVLRAGFSTVLTTGGPGHMGAEFASKRLLSEISHYWQNRDRHKKHALFFSCCSAFKGAIAAVIFPELLLIGFKYTQPFLIYRVIDAVQHRDNTDIDERRGLVGATLLTFGGFAVCRAATLHMRNRLLTRVRGGLLSQLYEKSLRLRPSEARKEAAIALMSADMEGIATGVVTCIGVPFAFIESAIGMYLVSRFIQLSCLSILGPLIASTLISLAVGKYMAPAMVAWNEAVQKRVTMTSRMLLQLPGIKVLGLGPKMAEFIQHLRVSELASSRNYRLIQALAVAAAVLIDMGTPVTVVASALFNNAFGTRLSAEAIYPTLATVFAVRDALAHLPRVYSSSTAMLACFERIRVFLCQPDHNDPRVIVPNFGDENGQRPTFGQTEPSFVLRFDAVKLGARGGNLSVLQNVNFELRGGSVSAVAGPTGSGKSLLLEAMLGEADVLDGQVSIAEDALSIALCAQFTWLPNVKVWECIVGVCDYDRVWLDAVIFSCQLLQDLRELPGGENHVIGSDGFTLSGGQRQRLSVARAAYARKKAIILDDPFRAMNKETAIAILSNLCGRNGILRESNCAVVISSYSSVCLDVADQLLLLDGSGNVSCEPCKTDVVLRSQVAHMLDSGLLKQSGGGKTTRTEPDSENSNAALPSAPPRNDESGLQVRSRGDAKLHMFWIDSIGRVRFCFLLLDILALAVVEAFHSIFIRIWLHFAPENKLFFTGYASIAVATGFLVFINLYSLYTRLAPHASNGLHEALITTVTSATMGYINAVDAGTLLNRFSQDMELLTTEVPRTTFNALYVCASTIMETLMVVSASWYLVFIIPPLLVALYFIQRYFLRTTHQLRLMEMETKAPLVTAVREASVGLSYIRGLGCQELYCDRYFQAVDESQRPFYLLLSAQASLNTVLELISTTMAAIVVAVALLVDEKTADDAVGLSLIILLMMGTYLNRAVSNWTVMEISVGSLSRLSQFLKLTPTEANAATVTLPADWPSTGEIELRNVTARYKTDKEDSLQPVLRNLSLRIEAGKKVGIMGQTGSGKTSLLSTLLGFLESDGSITIDGVDIKTVNPDELRSRVITISQHQVKLEGTIRDNLLPYEKTWGPPALGEESRNTREAERKDEIIRETLVRLRIWDPLAEKQGLDTLLEDAGFSHGEIQLLCIARAVIRRRLTGSKLLLVDEATGSVDHCRDQIVREMIIEYFKGCTIIIIAHREESIADSNITIHIDSGRIERIETYE